MNGALPPFDLSASELGLVVIRATWLMALLSGFGTQLSLIAIVRPASPARGAISRLARGSLLFAIGAGLAWLLAETADLASSLSIDGLVGVIDGTRFGAVLAAQLLLIAVAGFSHPGRIPALSLTALAVILEAAHAHAAAMVGLWSLGSFSAALHALAAGAWLGGLVPLALVLRGATGGEARQAALAFSQLGIAAVLTLIVTAGFQAWLLVGDLPGLVGTAYGWIVGIKAALFAGLILLALVNRFALTPGLGEQSGRHRLVVSITVETGLGLLVVVAAGVLSALPPAIHIQPIWPFALQPSLITLDEAPELKPEVAGAVLGLALALLVAALGIMVRRLRWPALATSLVIALFAAPHLHWLLVEAYPTSFYRSPSGFTASSIAEGAALYPERCASCHGADGTGHGPAAAGLPVPPADLTAGHLWGHSDGELYWWLSHGIETEDGEVAMPGFSNVLDDGQIWSLIDFVRARNAGLARSAEGGWSPPVRAPDFSASCTDGTVRTLADAHGHVVRLIVGADPAASPVAAIDGITVESWNLRLDGDTKSPPASCVGDDPAAVTSYALLAGLAPEQMRGATFLIDPDGWLRVFRPAGSVGGTPLTLGSPEEFMQTVRQICTHPIVTSEASHAHHHE